jgi:hypothetical protein
MSLQMNKNIKRFELVSLYKIGGFWLIIEVVKHNTYLEYGTLISNSSNYLTK